MSNLTPVFHLLTWRFWGFLPSRGDSLDRLTWNLAQQRKPNVPSVLPNFTMICPYIWEFPAPKYKNRYIFKLCRDTCTTPLLDFHEIYPGFPSVLTFQFWRDSVYKFDPLCCAKFYVNPLNDSPPAAGLKTRRGQIHSKFSKTPAPKLMVVSEKVWGATCKNGMKMLYLHAKFGGDPETEKSAFLYRQPVLNLLRWWLRFVSRIIVKFKHPSVVPNFTLIDPYLGISGPKNT